MKTLTLEEAQYILNQISFGKQTEVVSLIDSLQRILAVDIFSDVDMPPFNKSAMDGYACRIADLSAPIKVIGTIHAGEDSSLAVNSGTCVKIMTGAAVPKGAEIVIMVEHTENIDSNTIRYTHSDTKSNICLLGEDVKQGDLLIGLGTLISPRHIAVLASAGATNISVYKKPVVCLISTGSELVEPEIKPEGTKIRNSNAYNLLAQLKTMHIDGRYLGIIEDDEALLMATIEYALNESDLLILTGGASMGEKDFVPRILAKLGLRIVFDRIAVQPGKPVAFAEGNGKLCFGLSGNPVSSFIQFETLVKPFLYSFMGMKDTPPKICLEMSNTLVRKQKDRLKFFPIAIDKSGKVSEIPFNGSAHISGLTHAHGFGLFPLGCEKIEAGDKIDVILLS